MSPILSRLASAGIINNTGGFNVGRRRPSGVAAGLYNFTSATFTPGGATGRTGPTLTQAKSGLSGNEVNDWKDNTDYFNTSSGIMLWTVPKTGTYTIEAWGSQGGNNTGTSGSSGGLGARIKGDFTLTQGDKIKILVGQRLDAARTCGAVGGGGGSFAVKNTVGTPSTSDIFVIAGGGGGGGRTGSTYNGTGGTTSTSGTNSPNSPAGAGGSSGNGGGIPTAGCSGPEGAGGGGFSGNGTNPSSGVGGGQSFTNGGLGGDGGAGVAGGFGGGGAANGNGYGGGGGGGYSGGGAGGLSGNCTCGVMGGGGGGGSYNNGTNQSNTGATWSGEGKVTITFVA